ncbi:DUF7715 family protein [Actinomadura sp. WAC 06369]|uniref:DUF7715 family protein n=1 Tax=Actinomadura sp. WAC 06369 TaxID=2203193 RepID=UPI000F76D1A7|nr:hypothetical protein [Actinomadura sp. WAC 06369]RSN71343.1 hypothetical protein DMH08_02775 [Actinomadura sp. WAC 06369]
MRVLAAPPHNPRRDDGFTYTIPGELLYRPFACDSDQDGQCGYGRAWVGITSRKGTTAAQIAEHDITVEEYAGLIAAHFTEVWGWDPLDGRHEAAILAEIALEFPLGALITIAVQGDHDAITQLEM